MQPDIATDFDLQFTAPLSAWWLLLLLPLLLAGVWYLYRNQYKGLPRFSVIGLTVLRLVLLGVLVVLAFRPNITRRRTLTYPGRVVFLVDDSESMTARDTRMDAALALRIARRLDPSLAEKQAVYDQLATQLAGVETEMRRFQKFAAEVKRDSDAFWEQRDQVQDACLKHFTDFSELLPTAPAFWEEHLAHGQAMISDAEGLSQKAADQEQKAAAEEKKTGGSQELADSYRREAERRQRQSLAWRRQANAYLMRYQGFKQEFGAQADRIKDFKARLQPFISGSKDPGDKAYDQYVEKLTAQINLLREMQAEVDRAALTAGDSGLQEVVNRIRGQTRLQLLSARLGPDRAALAALAGKQHVQYRSLMTGAECPDLAQLEASPGATAILPQLAALIEADNAFPLTAVVLLSDGRDLSGRDASEITQAYSRKRTPIYAGAAGALAEPRDLAVLQVLAPPVAVRGNEVEIGARLKTALDDAEKINLRILRNGNPVGAGSRDVDGEAELQVGIICKPADVGVFRYQAKLENVKNEAFPLKNNAADFGMQVRDEKIKVLFLDWKPRWETRFALNILQRLSYVDLNAIIVVAQENGQLKRGSQRGAWPESAAALQMYDLVILGDLPQDLLTAREWQDLQAFVQDQGRTVCFIGTGKGPAVPADIAAAQDLLPVTTTGTQAVALTSTDDLRFTPAGRLHPLTAAIAAGGGRADTAVAGLPPQSILLARDQHDRGVIALRYAGRGRTLLIASDELWRVLNPTMLEAHTRLYVNLVTWAVQGGSFRAETAAPVPDLQVAPAARPLQLWAPAGSGQILQAVSGEDQVVAEAKAESGQANGLDRFVFASLPGQDLTFRLKERPEVKSAPVVLVRDDDELKQLSRNAELLRKLAGDTGGEVRELIDVERFFLTLQPKERVERQERIWRLWDLRAALVLIVILLTVEWVWRKFVGLV